VEITYLTWTEDNLLRQVSYQGQREDKPARQVVRAISHPLRRPGGVRFRCGRTERSMLFCFGDASGRRCMPLGLRWWRSIGMEEEETPYELTLRRIAEQEARMERQKHRNTSSLS
jgi:hypothetical protein